MYETGKYYVVSQGWSNVQTNSLMLFPKKTGHKDVCGGKQMVAL
jgi:hypothetical protein